MASVKVAVRVRPMNRREKDLNAKFIISMEKNKTTITNLKVPEGSTGDIGRERTKTFTYDFSYFSADSKSPSFVCQEMVDVSLPGLNATGKLCYTALIRRIPGRLSFVVLDCSCYKAGFFRNLKRAVKS